MNSKMDSLALIPLNWNSAHDVKSLLDNLPIELVKRVILVDNGSDNWESEKDILGSHLKNVTLVLEKENRGYAAGMNAGLQKAKIRGDKHAIILNADCLPTAEIIASVTSALENPENPALVGIKQHSFRSDGTRDTYRTASLGNGLSPTEFTCPGCLEGLHRVSFVSGALIGFNLDLFNNTDFFDDSYFHYVEETDLCYRTVSRGEKTLWICNISLEHKRGSSMPNTSPRAAYYRTRNQILYYRKNVKLKAISLLYPKLVVTLIRLGLKSRNEKTLRAYFNGLKDGLKNISGKTL